MITGRVLLDGALLTVSLFNAIVMLWLGLTVLFNAGHRRPAGRSGAWGFWLAAGCLLLGGVFFLLHTVLLGFDPHAILPGMDFWWRAGWIVLVVLPFAWYAVMLWYAGFWEGGAESLFRRHRAWFLLCAASALAWILLALTSPPLAFLPSLPYVEGYVAAAGGFPGEILLYPLFMILCIALAYDALRRPGPTARLLGASARLRARPWLSAASAALLAVCLLVAVAEAWVLLNLRTRSAEDFLTVLGMLDLVISAIIAAAVVLLGQAIVAYEVFTGRILPRRGLARYWRNALLLAGGFSAVTALSLAGGLLPVFTLVLAAATVTVFYALLARRSYTERSSFLEILRPFVSSQQLVERLTADAPPPWEADAAGPFRTLCRDILNCSRAALAASGPMASFWGSVLAYPESLSIPAASFAAGDGLRPGPSPLDADRADGMRWTISLWSRRGRIGTLLLGDKRDGSLYTQEDFELAQAVCERLIDTQTTAELARRLVVLERERLTDSRLLDRRTRRVLHDDVLPSLHAILLSLDSRSGSDPESERILADLAELHRSISQLLLDAPPASPSGGPPGDLVTALRQLLAEEMPEAFDSIDWEIDSQAEDAARRLPPMSREVWFHAAREAIRNAAKYGRGPDSTRPLHLRLVLTLSTMLELGIADDGVGLAHGIPEEGTTRQGLALHSTLMAVLGGELVVESGKTGGTVVRLILPRTAGLPPEPDDLPA